MRFTAEQLTLIILIPFFVVFFIVEVIPAYEEHQLETNPFPYGVRYAALQRLGEICQENLDDNNLEEFDHCFKNYVVVADNR